MEWGTLEQGILGRGSLGTGDPWVQGILGAGNLGCEESLGTGDPWLQGSDVRGPWSYDPEARGILGRGCRGTGIKVRAISYKMGIAW